MIRARTSKAGCSQPCHAGTTQLSSLKPRHVQCSAQSLSRPARRPEASAEDPTGQRGNSPLPQQQPQHPWPAQQQAAAHQQEQPPQLLQQQRAQQLLSRPSRAQLGGAAVRQAVQQQRAAGKRVLLDDDDPKMAVFDQLEVQVTCPHGAKRPQPAASFNRGPGVVRPVLAGNLRTLRINRPTPLQGHMLPALRAGYDLLAAGPPGAGTSSAALLALLGVLLSTPRSVPRNRAMPLALLLCPSRELAVQLAGQGAAMVAGTQLTVKCATGGSPVTQQVLELRHGADLLVATPGRLLDLLAKKTVSLARLKLLVMEDVDELMGPVLLPVSRQVLHHHTMPGQQQRQTIALGSSALPQQQLLAAAADVLRPDAVVIRAAWPLPQQQQQQQQHDAAQSQPQQQQQPPQQQQLLHPQQLAGSSSSAQFAGLLADPAAALATSAAAAASAIPPSVTQRFLGVAPQLKMRFLLRLLSSAGAGGGGGLVLVFTNSHTAAEEVGRQLAAAGVAAGVLHFARSQAQRDEALQCFKYGVTQVLVACGIGYRGLDLPDVSQVVNFDVPLSLAEYARRLGRAGRGGRPGVGSTLVTPGDGAAVAALVSVLRAGGQAVPDWLLSLAEGGRGEAGSSKGDEAADGSEQAAGVEQQSGRDSGSRVGGAPPALFSVRGRVKQQLGAYIDGEEPDERR